MDIAQRLMSGDLDEIITSMSQTDWLTLLLLTLLFMVIQNFITIIPVFLLITLNVTVFGWFSGYVWSWFCSMIGAIFAFFIVRFWLHSWFVSKVNVKWQKKLEMNGFWFVFGARLFPFAPTSIINITAGMSTIRFSHYLYSTMLGNALFYIIMSLAAFGIVSLDLSTSEWLILIVVLTVVAGTGIYIWRRAKQVKGHGVKRDSE